MSQCQMKALETCREFSADEEAKCDCKHFESNDEIYKSIIQLCCGDLYLIGKLWIEALKLILVGSKITLFPVVHAAKPPEEPPRPPPMKYTDLPLYQSPHFEYKDFQENKSKCPDVNVKLLHRALLPTVREYRKMADNMICDTKCELVSTYKEVCHDIEGVKRDIKKYFRDPSRLELRKAVVAIGGITGYLIARKKGIPSRLFYTGVGVLAGGFLCFPCETDEYFRTFLYHTGKNALTFFNSLCCRNLQWRERLSCEADMPPQRKPYIPNKCPPKK